MAKTKGRMKDSSINKLHKKAEANQFGEQQITAELTKKETKLFFAILIPVVIALIVLITVVVKVIIPAGKYHTAIQLIEEGQYVQAYDRLISLRDYKDASIRADEIYSQYKIEKLKIAKTGEYVCFGNYEQDNDAANGKEEIEWLVLKKEGSKSFLISLYALDCQKFNATYTDVSWETCSLRSWLNHDFLTSAFNEDEQKRILNTSVSADRNAEFESDPGHDTQDKVYLLSIQEANEYFKTDEERKCAPTDYAIAQGAWTSSEYTVNDRPTGWWWLRSPGSNAGSAADVNYDGAVYGRGVFADYDDDCVRPAMWIETTSD